MIRQASLEELDTKIFPALQKMWAGNSTNQFQFVDEAKSYAFLVEAQKYGRLVIAHETFAILFDVGSQWYTSALYLIEELVIRISRRPISADAAIDALNHLKVMNGCEAIVVGDANHGAMIPKYLKAGYRVLATQLIKD